MYNRILDFVESKIDGFERPEIVVDYMNNEFSYGVESRDIYVPEKVSSRQKRWWVTFMLNYIFDEFDTDLDIDDNYVFSFLHELGHFITLEGIESNVVDSQYSKYMSKLNPREASYETDYRRNPIERMADLWAITFIINYPEVLEIVKVNLI